MPSDTTPEQAELRRRGRQRLTGAVALALLAVVFVPMILDPEPRRERPEPLLAIPPKDGAAPLAPVATTPEPPVPRAEAVPTEAKAAPPAAMPALPVPKLEGFVVQVGAFKDAAKLLQAREKLTAAGIAHFTDRQPDFTRLRVGPFPTREAAEKAVAGVKRAGLDGRVVPLP